MHHKHLFLYHADCLDGFGAAYAAWLVLGDTATYLPYQYGMAPPDATNKTIYIADFSFSKAEMDTLNIQANKVVLLDHHQSAIDALHGYSCGCARANAVKFGYSESDADEPVIRSQFAGHTVLDVTKSGARLTWEYFHGHHDVPEMIQFIEDRDLWVWKYGETTRHFMAALDATPRTFEAWDTVREMSPNQRKVFMSDGVAMCRQFKSLLKSLAKEARPLVLNGVEGLMVNSSREFASDLGQLLAEQVGTFGVVWMLEQDGKIKMSIRTVKENNCNIRGLAEAFNGGGHPLASAFRIESSRFPELASGALTSSAQKTTR